MMAMNFVNGYIQVQGFVPSSALVCTPLELNRVPPDTEGCTGKKRTNKRNPWGNRSYADLITQAIQNAPEKRLTLSQIYDWMVRNIPHFKDKGDNNSSAGWKNSIRHNLSLHRRFVRVRNESTGKSSWWILDPEAGQSRATRRKTPSSNLRRRNRRLKNPVPKEKKIPNQTITLSEVLKKNFPALSSTLALPINDYGRRPHNSSNAGMWNSSPQQNDHYEAVKRRWKSCSPPSSEDNNSFSSFSSGFKSMPTEKDSLFSPVKPAEFSLQNSAPPYQEIPMSSSTPQPFPQTSYLTHLETFNSPGSQGQLIENVGLESPKMLGINDDVQTGQSFPSTETHSLLHPLIDIVKSGHSIISEEYFMSPHHLSGSYISHTSESCHSSGYGDSIIPEASINFPLTPEASQDGFNKNVDALEMLKTSPFSDPENRSDWQYGLDNDQDSPFESQTEGSKQNNCLINNTGFHLLDNLEHQVPASALSIENAFSVEPLNDFIPSDLEDCEISDFKCNANFLIHYELNMEGCLNFNF